MFRKIRLASALPDFSLVLLHGKAGNGDHRNMAQMFVLLDPLRNLAAPPGSAGAQGEGMGVMQEIPRCLHRCAENRYRFTIAHSLTLSLATLQVVIVPARISESAIAMSVVLAALNNLFPIVQNKRWVVAFCFGLIHGFGFASVLTDLGLPRGVLWFVERALDLKFLPVH